MSSSPSTEATVADFVCDCSYLALSACVGLPFYKEYEGEQYCVLHYPDKEKAADFDVALKRKLDAEDFNFSGVWFPAAVRFGEYRFTKPVNFDDAKFTDVADFYSAKFNAKASFVGASFRAPADFRGAVFGMEVNFTEATFKSSAAFTKSSFKEEALYINCDFEQATNFSYSVFNKRADFYGAIFSDKVYFSDATFADYLRFSEITGRQVFGPRSVLNLRHARVQKPEHVSFHTLTLRPHWFVNVDARKFEFVNVEWGEIKLAEEVKRLKHRVD